MSVVEQYLQKLEVQFSKLFELYEAYNKHTNLSALKEKQVVYEKHFADSLELLNFFDLKDGTAVLDLGSGGGFPVLPLAIVKTNVQFTALDATAKKTKFITQVKNELGLDNLSILTGRAEDFAHQESFRENFDYVLARAVAELRILLELASGFLKKDAHLYAYKSYPIIEEEQESLRAQNKLKLSLEKRQMVGSNRQILSFVKQESLNQQYPRLYSQIKNHSL